MKVPAAKIYFPKKDRKQILSKINEALDTGQLTLGKHGREFEEKFAKYVGTKHAVATNSGTSALEIILRALDIKGRSVIVPTNTFLATILAIIHAGAKPILADISQNLCLDPRSVIKNIKKDTKAVIIVHIGGVVSPQIKEIQKLCKKNKLFLIEDAAHAHGSTLNGKMAGTFGRAAAFSFYPTKVMTSGEGGMITTDDENLCKRALVFRDQGKAGFYGNLHTELGYNWRMSEPHAILGLAQLAYLKEFISARRKIAKIYDRGLKKIKQIQLLDLPKNVKSNYYKYVAFLDEKIDRSFLKKEMKEKYGVSLSGEVYELPCHLQPILKKLYGYKSGKFPVAERLCRTQVCLPVFPTMSRGQAKYVVNSLKKSLTALNKI